jgi:hypothetical protein
MIPRFLLEVIDAFLDVTTADCACLCAGNPSLFSERRRSAMTVTTQEIRGIRVVSDEAVSPVRLGFAVMGKPPVQQSYPSLPQRFSPIGHPGWRHLRIDAIDAERAALRAGRSESDSGDLVMRSLAMCARQAVQLGRPTAEGSVQVSDTTAHAPLSAYLARTSPLNSNAQPSPAARFHLAKKPTLGRAAKSARAQKSGLGASSATSRGRSADGSCSSQVAITATAESKRISQRAAD